MKASIALLAAVSMLAACSQPASNSASASASATASAGAATSTSAPAAAPAAAATASSGRQFAYGNHVPPARITALTGVDTATAEMSGRVNEADARAYCAGQPADPSGRETAETCVAGVMSEQGARVMTAMADCTARRLNYMGDSYTPVRPDAENAGYLVFRSEEHSQIQDNSGAGGGLVLNDLFSTLCPAAFRAAGGTQLNP